MVILTPDQQNIANDFSTPAAAPVAPVDSGALPPLGDRLKDALPAWGGPPLRHEYSDAPYKHAVKRS